MTEIGPTREEFAVGEYLALPKLRVMSLPVFTAWAGYAPAPMSLPPVLTAVEGF